MSRAYRAVSLVFLSPLPILHYCVAAFGKCSVSISTMVMESSSGGTTFVSSSSNGTKGECYCANYCLRQNPVSGADPWPADDTRIWKRAVLQIGRVDFRNDCRLFGIKDEDRFSHVYVIGKT